MDTIFPPAEAMLERTKKAWPEKKPEEILENMNKEANDGNRVARFFNATLAERTERELIQQHYRVKKGEMDNSPYFKISW